MSITEGRWILGTFYRYTRFILNESKGYQKVYVVILGNLSNYEEQLNKNFNHSMGIKIALWDT